MYWEKRSGKSFLKNGVNSYKCSSLEVNKVYESEFERILYHFSPILFSVVFYKLVKSLFEMAHLKPH